jgi:hypothetical protein
MQIHFATRPSSITSTGTRTASEARAGWRLGSNAAYWIATGSGFSTRRSVHAARAGNASSMPTSKNLILKIPNTAEEQVVNF